MKERGLIIAKLILMLSTSFKSSNILLYLSVGVMPSVLYVDKSSRRMIWRTMEPLSSFSRRREGSRNRRPERVWSNCDVIGVWSNYEVIILLFPLLCNILLISNFLVHTGTTRSPCVLVFNGSKCILGTK